MSTDNQPATKKDLRNLKEDIVEELSGVFSASMTIIGINFQSLKDDSHQIKATIGRMEHKLDSTIGIIANHSVRISKLQQKTANI